jgi:hypothetical protein
MVDDLFGKCTRFVQEGLPVAVTWIVRLCWVMVALSAVHVCAMLWLAWNVSAM